MTQTLSEQILSHASGRTIHAGELAVVEVGRVMTVDSLAPEVIAVLQDQLGASHLPHPERCAIFIDHVAPAANVATAEAQIKARVFAREQGISAFYDAGCGICHQLMIEEKAGAAGQRGSRLRLAQHDLWSYRRIWYGDGHDRHRAGICHRPHLATRA